MPNVEIHGLRPAKAEELRGRIFALFQDEPYADEMVVTTCLTIVRDRHGNDQPFLRLCESPPPHTEEILGRLGVLGMDIEVLDLADFIPKKAGEESS